MNAASNHLNTELLARYNAQGPLGAGDIEALAAERHLPAVQVWEVASYMGLTQQDSPAAQEPLPEKIEVLDASASVFGRWLREPAVSLGDYRAAGGYAALEIAKGLSPEEIVQRISGSGLRGRGGAAFPTGRKWTAALEAKGSRKYVVCNADEGEPGAYKDRLLIQEVPHAVLEGTIIAARAIGAAKCFIYVRRFHKAALAAMEKAVSEAIAAGLAPDLEIEVVPGDGPYICGEGTTLVNTLEGRRGEPRIKPPSMAIAGFEGAPTVVDNVETLAHVPFILTEGGEAYRDLGSESCPGTRLVSVTAPGAKPRCIEAAGSATVRDVLQFCGCQADGAVLVGGPSGHWLSGEELAAPLDPEWFAERGGALGTASVEVVGGPDAIREKLAAIASFFARESCGQCASCREGSRRVLEILRRIQSGCATVQDRKMLESLHAYLQDTAFCPLGQGILTAQMGAMEKFPGAFAKTFKERIEICPM